MAVVLISGGSGLIGTSLSRFLLSRGHRVAVLTRSPQTKLAYGESILWDGKRPGVWTEWVQKADWIVNLAGANIGASRWTASRLQEIRESRIYAGQLLVDAITRSPHQPSVFVQMSAIGAYGIQSKSDPAGWDESQPYGTDRLAQICREWEASSAPIEKLGVRRLVLRTGLVLSARGGVLPRMELPFRLFIGGPLGDGRQVYSWIHLDDLIQAMYALLEDHQAGGVYNFTAPGPVTNAEFAHKLGQILHRPSSLPVPAIALRLMLGEMSTLVLNGQRIIPGRLQTEIRYRFQYPDLESALRQVLASP
ncbi:MAG: TIGR01777 family protein [Leptolinea sp.]|nr:TIGR01777 family protein [Leptolinea sp.]